MREYDAVVFDMDGVIFDSERATLVCWLEIAKKYDIKDIEKPYMACTGTTYARTKEIMMETDGPDFPYEEYAKEASVIYHERYDGGRLPVKKGVKEILEFLKKNKKKIALASSTRRQTVINQLRDAGILEYFDEVVTGDMVSRSKPEPDIFLLACEKINVSPERAYAIEDSYNGIRAAFAGKLRPIMVPDLLPANDEMKKISETVCGSLLDVIDYLKDPITSVKKVMNYLASIQGKKIIAGQHTQTMAMEELAQIKKVTGKEPALLGFELLSYSPNINYSDTDEECMREVAENKGTIECARNWAKKRGLITMTWHWFSPMGGRGKSFFTENTGFDASKAVCEGTPENAALLSDMDYMAGLLRPFCDAKIPILWRPFHECDGAWFWWGAKDDETVIKLWRIMYERFTYHFRLDNLIWVWNGTKAERYPGDAYVDIISRDMYPPAHEHTSCIDMYKGMEKISEDKIILIGETGSLPDPEAIVKDGAGWASFMTWSKVFCLTEEYTSFDYLRKVYNSEFVITLDELPELY